MTDHMSDDEDLDHLLRQLVSGSDKAFETACVHLIPTLLEKQEARCRKLRIPIDLAEDIVNETIRRAITWMKKNREVIDKPQHLLNKISKQVSFNFLKKIHKHEHEVLADDHKWTNNKSLILGLILKEAVEKLSQSQRDILNLILEQGLSVGGAAQFLKIEPWAAYKRYERALGKLRSILEEDII